MQVCKNNVLQKNERPTFDFKPELLQKQQRIVIYGASVYGEIAYYLLESIGLKAVCYCDRVVKDKFMGLPVIEQDELASYRKDWVLIASADYFHELVGIVKEIGCEYIGNLAWLFFNCQIPLEKLSKRAVGYYVNRQNYIDVSRQTEANNALNFTRIQFVVTERCSLRCKDCLHLMQYYKNPQNVDLDAAKGPFDRLLRIAENISEIRILGGEPFVNSAMYKVIEWWHSNSNIRIFRIYTNGTLIPSDETMKWLTYPKVSVYISDYGINSERIKKLIKKFDERGIKYYVSPYDGWADAGDLHFRNHTVQENIEIFGRCHARNCISYMNGALHRCPRSAHAMRLGAMPDTPADYVDIANFKGSDEELKAAIKKLQDRIWIEACNYCDGADLHVPQIPAGVQADATLLF